MVCFRVAWPPHEFRIQSVFSVEYVSQGRYYQTFFLHLNVILSRIKFALLQNHDVYIPGMHHILCSAFLQYRSHGTQVFTCTVLMRPTAFEEGRTTLQSGFRPLSCG